VMAFLTSLATQHSVAASTPNQALAALLFLYREVLAIELPWMDAVVRARRPKRLPTVLSGTEARTILDGMQGVHGVMARLMYGTGMRVTECLALRVKDLDIGRRQITIRQGKGGKDRVTMLPEALIEPLRSQLRASREVYARDREAGLPGVELPFAYERKNPGAGDHGAGTGYSPRTTYRSTHAVASADGITPMSKRCNVRSSGRRIGRASRSRYQRTPCATPLPPISWKRATISARCRSSSVTRT